jgi:hypothetical protein
METPSAGRSAYAFVVRKLYSDKGDLGSAGTSALKGDFTRWETLFSCLIPKIYGSRIKNGKTGFRRYAE